MGKYEGGYIGARPEWNQINRSGVWTPQSVFHRQKTNFWLKENDPFFGSVVLYLKGDGENNSINIIDSSLNTKTVVKTGTPVISTVQKKYGGSSVYFNRSSFLEINDSSAFSYAGDFTVECWYYPTLATPDQALFTINNYTDGILCRSRSDAGLIYVDGGIAYPAFSPSLNTWHHLAISRSGSTVRAFLNGNSTTPLTSSGIINTSNNGLRIGSPYDGNFSTNYTGYIDSFRVTKGVARYITNFNRETDTYLAY